MAKLNQIVAVVSGKKTRLEQDFGDINKIVQKQDLFSGLVRQYQPLDENGEKLPNESKFPQKNVKDVVIQVREILTGIMDAIATQETGNCSAKADVIVDDVVILKSVPVTVLLYLEKQMNDLRTFVSNLPLLDPADVWSLDANSGRFFTEQVKTIRSKKMKKVVVLYPHSEQHPAQTQLVEEDVAVGNWSTVKYSTAISAADKNLILARILKLQDAVKVAREEANSIEVQQKQIAEPVLNFIFGN